MFTREQQVHRGYNMKQTEVGSCLKTLKGSRIQRSKFGVGKVVGYYLYFHKSYMTEILNEEEIARIAKAERKYKKDIDNSDILLIDDSIGAGQTVQEAINVINSLYSPKSVTVLTLDTKNAHIHNYNYFL